ncbi:MAG: alkaline phosphatase family protein [Gemmatimonadota bacterium]|nr:MAG: alkaline phosphatase family protein [Gemmatimonadota bacterium]
MKRAVFFLVVSGVLLTACGEPAAKKVLVIGIDGVRPDVLAQVSTPHIDALIAAGAFSGAVVSEARTVSGPSWSSILTGVWPEKHGVNSNDLSSNNYDRYPDFLTRLELERPELNTFAVVDWPPLGTEASGGPLLGDTIDVKLTFDGEAAGYATADAQSVAAAVRYIGNQDPDAAFVYIGYPDVAAHEHGAASSEYYAAIGMADAHVGALVEAVRGRATYAAEDWLILVTTDHGHLDEGGHGGVTPEERTVFYLAVGPAALSGSPGESANLVDIAVTAMAHLGVEADPDWQLDGRVSGLAGRR